MTRAMSRIPALALAGAAALLALALPASPVHAYGVTVQLQPFPNCLPGKLNSFCSLTVIVTNGAPAVPAPLKHRLRITFTPAFQVASAAQSGGPGTVPTKWACVIVAGGTAVRCVNNGPTPVAANAKMANVAMRVRLRKVVSGPNGRVCVQAAVYNASNAVVSPVAQACLDITIVP